MHTTHTVQKIILDLHRSHIQYYIDECCHQNKAVNLVDECYWIQKKQKWNFREDAEEVDNKKSGSNFS